MRAHVWAGLRGLLGVLGLRSLRGFRDFYGSLGSLGVLGLLGCAWGSSASLAGCVAHASARHLRAPVGDTAWI